MKEPTLWYFADPMCSWCWGFSPVIEAIREAYRDRLKVALILGGLRVGTTDVMSDGQRREILQHWHEVHEKTGQPFLFAGALGDGFVYDTEPACRAVLAIAEQDPKAVFPLFKSIQMAFYGEGRDVTHPDVLVELVEGLGVERRAFLAAFESEQARANTLAHFQMARKLAVRGFPTLVAQQGERHAVLTMGYRPLRELQADIEHWLAAAASIRPSPLE